jgi:hypothetical protein
MHGMLLLLAAAAAPSSQSTMDRLRAIPTEFWVKIGIGIVAIIAIVIALRKIAKVNKLVLGIIVCLVLSFVGFSWIYERNEPDWATPAVQWLAGFFPSKGKVNEKGHQNR